MANVSGPKHVRIVHTEDELKDVNFMPPVVEAVPLGIQHVLAMFVAGVATLVQSLGMGPIGARVPIVMGTSCGFVPVIIPIAVTYGLPAVVGAAFVGGLAMTAAGFGLRWVRFLFPTVVTGTFVIMIGIILLPVGFAYGGYVVAIPLDLVDFSKVANAAWLQMPAPFEIGLEFVPVAIVSIVLNLVLPGRTPEVAEEGDQIA